MSDQKQIFAYLKSAHISEDDLLFIQEAGFITVAVDDYNDFKVIDITPMAHSEIIAECALKQIKSDTPSTRQHFADRVLKAILEATPDTTGGDE